MSSRIFYYIFVAFSLIELFERSSFPLPLGTYVYAIIIYFWLIQIFIYIRKNYKYISYNYNGNKIIACNVVCSLIMIIRGLSHSDNYWQYKDVLLSNGPSLFFFLAIYLSTEIHFCAKCLSYIIKYYLLASVLLINDARLANTGRIMCNTLPLLGYFLNKYKWYIIIFTLYSLTLTWDARGWVLRALFGLTIGLCYIFFQRKISKLNKIIIGIVFSLFLLTPLLCAYLGYIGVFNVFNMQSYMDNSSMSEDDLVDTRSFLYILVQNKLETSESVVGGVGLAVSYWDDFNAESNVKELQNFGRTATESGLLNMYFWGGIIGVFLYSMIYWMAAYYGIFRSKNNFCKLIGLFIIFRWVISFVDEPNGWVCSNIMLYFFMGICLNKKIRNLDDEFMQRYLKIE